MRSEFKSTGHNVICTILFANTREDGHILSLPDDVLPRQNMLWIEPPNDAIRFDKYIYRMLSVSEVSQLIV